MSKQDWSEFKQRILVIRTMGEVYNAWSTRENITSWFLERAIYTSKNGVRDRLEPIEKGDNFSWKWHNWEAVEEGTILEANGSDHIGFTFGKGGIVDIELREGNGGTWVELTQREIPTDEDSKMHLYVGCATGWAFWLTNLKAWLEHGITLNITGLSQDETAHLVNS